MSIECIFTSHMLHAKKSPHRNRKLFNFSHNIALICGEFRVPTPEDIIIIFFCWWFVFELSSARHGMKAKIYVNFSPFFGGKFALGDLCSNNRFLIVLYCVIVLLKSINLGEFLGENLPNSCLIFVSWICTEENKREISKLVLKFIVHV